MAQRSASAEALTEPIAESLEVEDTLEVLGDATPDADGDLNIHVLNMGRTKYGDCLIVESGATRILIDGGHPYDDRPGEGRPPLQDQMRAILGGSSSHRFDLLIVTHTHGDHIGCLPSLIEGNLIAADYALVADPDLGWPDRQDDAPEAPARARRLTAALREESMAAETDDAEIWRFLLDVERLEESYRRMLRTLTERGTRLARYGNPADNALRTEIENRFRTRAGMTVLGPSPNHLSIATEYLRRIGRDSLTRATDALRSDAAHGVNDAELYRTLAARPDQPGPGAALNDQSIVLLFERGATKVLLTGDMQFAAPEVPNLNGEMRTLREMIAARAPYALVKIAHHGSYNALDENVLAELGDTRRFVISTGRAAGHPNNGVLALLNRNRRRVDWYRNDRNGVISFRFPPTGAPRISIDAGAKDDASSNGADAEAATGEVARGGSQVAEENTGGRAAGGGGGVQSPHRPIASRLTPAGEFVEVFARVPHTTTRVTLTIDVQPGANAAGTETGETTSQATAREPAPETGPEDDGWRLAGGRKLPPLLFVTDSARLGTKVTHAGANALLASIRAEHALLDLTGTSTDAAGAAEKVRARLAAFPEIRGVVLVGGQEVIPSQKLDTLGALLRERVDAAGFREKYDNFIVWSDDCYGDKEGDGIPELPVSRVPDGNSLAFLRAALKVGAAPASAYPGGPRAAVRNIQRPFADDIYAFLPGDAPMRTCADDTYETLGRAQPEPFRAERLYLMLHGDYQDATRFWGEMAPSEAVNLTALPAKGGPRIVFSGCCWGAMSVDTPAALVSETRPTQPRTPQDSLALGFLARGAVAFVGCTGMHYSPGKDEFGYGGPMHAYFWKHSLDGKAPAEALYLAKADYALGLPYYGSELFDRAVESKILRQYTCLGLGW